MQFFLDTANLDELRQAAAWELYQERQQTLLL